jgi:tetratricopeptide (TPR) repeat protein
MLIWMGAVSALLSMAPQAGAPSLADAYYFFIQGRTLEGQGDVSGALAAYKRAAELEPHSSTIHAEMAGLYARAGKATESINEAEAALAIDPADREAHRILGLVRSALADGQPPGPRQQQAMRDAVTHLELALGGARDPGAELTLGRLDVRLGRLEEAIPVLRNFLLDNPGYPEGVMLLAEAYERTGDFASTTGVLEPVFDALRRAPRESLDKGDEDFLGYAGMSLANAYQALGQTGRTEEVLRALIDRNPKNDVALNALGYMLADRNLKLPEAQTLIERALAVEPQSPSYLDSLGWVLLKQGRAADAIASLERATALAESSSLLQDHLATAYFAEKRYKDAADAWTRALAGDREGVDLAAVTQKRDAAKALIKSPPV